MLLAALAAFCVFFSNVSIGAATGSAFLSDVGEALTLFAACVCFVVAVLQREGSARRSKLITGEDPDREEDCHDRQAGADGARLR